MKTAVEMKRQYEKTHRPLNLTPRAGNLKQDASTLQSTSVNKETLFERNTERLTDIISNINYIDNQSKRSPTKADFLLEVSIESAAEPTLFGGLSQQMNKSVQYAGDATQQINMFSQKQRSIGIPELRQTPLT